MVGRDHVVSFDGLAWRRDANRRRDVIGRREIDRRGNANPRGDANRWGNANRRINWPNLAVRSRTDEENCEGYSDW